MTQIAKAPHPFEQRMTIGSIRKGTRHAPDRILLVGVEGIGKSTFGADAPDPIFIASEDGIRHLNVASFPEPKSFQDVLDAIAVLRHQEHSYKTLVIDTLDWLEPLLTEALCQARGWADIEAPGFGKGWVAATDEWRKLLRLLDQLRAEKGMEVILLAHAAIKPFQNPSGPDFSRYEGKLNKGAMALVKEWTDTNLFAIHEDFVAKGKGEIKAKVTTSGKRIVHTERSATWDAKNRSNLPPVLPLGYADYADAREKGRPGDPAALEADARELLAQWAPDAATADVVNSTLKAASGDAAKLAKVVTRLRSKVAEKEGS